MGDKLTIAEARARRSDPVWRRRHKTADISGVALVAAVLIGPFVLGLLWPPLFTVAGVVLLVGAAAAVWSSGPKVGFERRTALLLAIPIVGLLVLVPATWRAAHLHLQRWRGPLQPAWGDTTWLLMSALGIVCWTATAVGLVVSLT